MTKAESNKIKVTNCTEVGYVNGEKIFADELKKWAFRRLLTWAELFAMCKEFLAALEHRIPDNIGQEYKKARIKELKELISKHN